MREFWMVWKEDGSVPTHQHYDEPSARREAERLAVSLGGRFYVLRAVGSCMKPAVIWDGPDKVHGADCRCDTCIPF